MGLACATKPQFIGGGGFAPHCSSGNSKCALTSGAAPRSRASVRKGREPGPVLGMRDTLTFADRGTVGE